MSSLRQITIAVTLIIGSVTSAIAQEWKLVKETMLYGISGMALVSHTGNRTQYLVVHDAKLPGEPRLAIITEKPGTAPSYENIPWPDDNPPSDAEAISALPGADDEFIVMASDGKLFHIKFNPSSNIIRVIRTFSFPIIPEGSNYEGLSFQSLNGNLLVVWANRGQDSLPATLYWGKFDRSNYRISSIGSDTIRVPWPIIGVRHIADLRLDPSGILYIVASSDLGNDGPFQSAFYIAGLFTTLGRNIQFIKNPILHRIMQFNNHKIEAMEFVPGPDGGIIFGSDDENMGGSIYTTWQ